jgi:DNA polymerase-1
MSAKKLMVLDGSGLLYRAYYALPDLKNMQGFPTNAIYGVITMVSKLLDDEKPDYCCVCFDLPDPTFRHEEFSDYKSQRKPTPEDLVIQISRAKEVLGYMGITCLEQKGFEADDIMAALAKAGAEQGAVTYLVTGDKDILQLVNKDVFVIRITQKSTEIYDEAKVKEKYGVIPSRLPDYLGLTGDSSDNIPGVPGVGEKTAKALLMQYGSLEAILENLPLIGNNRVRKALENNIELARKSRNLALLRDDVPISTQLDAYRIRGINKDKLRDLFLEFGFHRLLEQMGIEIPQEERLSEIQDIAPEKMKQYLAGGTPALALELIAENDEILIYSGQETAYRIKAGDLRELLDLLSGRTLYGFDLKPVFKRLIAEAGICDKPLRWADIALAGYLLHPFSGAPGLSRLAMTYLQRNINQGQAASGELELRFPEDIQKEYCPKIQAVYDLGLFLEKKLEAEGLASLYWDIEMPLAFILAEMEFTGIKVDIPYLRNLKTEMENSVATVSKEIYQLAGEEFNLNSPKQLATILFEKLKLPVVKKTKTGYSTDVDVLETLSEEHLLPAKILEYRTLAKVKSTYIDAYLQLARPGTDTIHTTFQQMVANTGRIISAEPNLQNLPVFTEWGKKIRRGFIPRSESHVFVSADYSQIELRMLAHLSQDQGLIQAFTEGKDIHTETALFIFKAKPEEITPEMRRAAKAINFGIVYGMSAYGLSKGIKISVDEAQAYIDAYFERFAGVRTYMEGVLKQARKEGYVTTILGRRCYVPDIKSSKGNLREAAERQAINAPVQGSAADLLKLAMIKLHHAIHDKKLKSKLLLTIHDELVLEVPAEELEEAKKTVAENMESALSLSVPVIVDISTGTNLSEC